MAQLGLTRFFFGSNARIRRSGPKLAFERGTGNKEVTGVGVGLGCDREDRTEGA